MSRYERLTVQAPPSEVLSALRSVLRARGFTEYAVVDHARDMAAAGQSSEPAWTVIFGNPAAGAKLLAGDLAAAVDIPLRFAVIAGTQGSEIVWRDMGSLLADARLAAAFTATLSALAGASADATNR